MPCADARALPWLSVSVQCCLTSTETLRNISGVPGRLGRPGRLLDLDFTPQLPSSRWLSERVKRCCTELFKSRFLARLVPRMTRDSLFKAIL